MILTKVVFCFKVKHLPLSSHPIPEEGKKKANGDGLVKGMGSDAFSPLLSRPLKILSNETHGRKNDYHHTAYRRCRAGYGTKMEHFHEPFGLCRFPDSQC